MSLPVRLFLALQQSTMTQVESFPPETQLGEKAVPSGAVANADGPQKG